MNKEVITLWANALDSGEFKQIPYPMHSGDGFDADGVLVELWRRKHGGEWARATSALKEDKGPDWTGYLEFQGSVFLPPRLVLEWLDLKCDCKKDAQEHTCEAQRVLDITNNMQNSFAETAKRLRELMLVRGSVRQERFAGMLDQKIPRLQTLTSKTKVVE